MIIAHYFLRSRLVYVNECCSKDFRLNVYQKNLCDVTGFSMFDFLINTVSFHSLDMLLKSKNRNV